MALQTLTAADLFHIITCEDPHEQKFIELAFGQGSHHIWLTLHLRVRDHTTLHSFGGVLGPPSIRTLSFRLSQFHDHNSWLVCEVALISKTMKHCSSWNLAPVINNHVSIINHKHVLILISKNFHCSHGFTITQQQLQPSITLRFDQIVRVT